MEIAEGLVRGGWGEGGRRNVRGGLSKGSGGVPAQRGVRGWRGALVWMEWMVTGVDGLWCLGLGYQGRWA